MKFSHIKVLIATLTEKIELLERELKVKEYSINVLQRKLKELEETR